MAFHIEKEWLYVQPEALVVNLKASVLQVKDRVWFPRNKAPDNAALWPITLASKSLSHSETQYCNIERESLSTYQDMI